MSELERLIQELCPNGVDYVQFRDICQYIRGITYNKSQEAKANDVAPWKVFRANNITLSSNTLNFDDVKLVKKEVKVKPDQILKIGDILICAGSGSKEHIGKVAFIKEDMDYTFGGFMAVIRCEERLNSRFMFHILTSGAFSNYLSFALNSTTINNLNSSIMNGFSFPLPPLEVQREIVRILDNFTELTAELTAELIARKKQYEYYQEYLLNKNNDIRFERLGDTCKMKSGKAIPTANISKDYTAETSYQCFGGNGVRGFVSLPSHHGEFPIIGRQGALCGNVNYASGDFYATEHAVVVESKGDYLQRFLYYLLTSMNLNQYKSQGAQPGLAVGNIENLLAPVPPIEEQQRIVDILDRFDALCNDISAGLPAEIEARQKQYEYYRDKLLNFKEMSV